MNIKRDRFLSNLSKVKAGLSSREHVDQSSCFVFQDGEVLTYNDEVACRIPIELNLHGAVQSEKLLEILAKIPDERLRVIENNNNEIEFHGKDRVFGVVKEADISLPVERVDRPEDWRPIPKSFAEAIGRLQQCVGHDESKFLLTCVHIAPNHLEACDNDQIMRFAISLGLKSSVLVRGASLSSLAAIGMDEAAITKGWIHFRQLKGNKIVDEKNKEEDTDAPLTISCRRYAEEYPKLDHLIEFKGHDIVIPKALKEVADRALTFAEDSAGEPILSVKVAGDYIRVLGEGLVGWYKERKRVDYSGPPIEFLIRPKILQYISENYKEAILSEDRLKIVGGNWQYVSSLGRAEDEEDRPPAVEERKRGSERRQVADREQDEQD